jgi:hypothetical protein
MNPNIISIQEQSSRPNDLQPAIWLNDESKGVSRRDFLATCSWMTAMVGLPAMAVCQACTKNQTVKSGTSRGLSRENKHREKPGLANDGDMFKPGDAVPASGIYDVIHDKLDGQEHALRHQITAIAGNTFPPCRGCQAWVRYRLYRAAEYIQENEHFKE